MEKPSPKKTATADDADVSRKKVIRLRNACKNSISYDKDYDKLEDSEKKRGATDKGVENYSLKAIRENAWEEVIGILVDGEDGWEPGRSQSMHQKVMNTRAYEY